MRATLHGPLQILSKSLTKKHYARRGVAHKPTFSEYLALSSPRSTSTVVPRHSVSSVMKSFKRDWRLHEETEQGRHVHSTVLVREPLGGQRLVVGDGLAERADDGAQSPTKRGICGGQ